MRHLLVWSVLVCACGGASTEPAAPVAPAAAVGVVAPGATDAGRVEVGSLRELTHRVPPGESIAYRFKMKTESPGRKTEQEFVLYLDAWSDGTVVAMQDSGERERTVSARELVKLLPLPEGAQTSYSRARDDDEHEKTKTTERFERALGSNGREQISFRMERKAENVEEVTDGTGTFDGAQMRYERLRSVKTRRFTMKNSPEPPRETKQEIEGSYDAEASAARVKERAARREKILKAAQEPPPSANPSAEVAAAIASQSWHAIAFHARARPAVVWRVLLAQTASSSVRLRDMFFEQPRVPDEILPELRATIRKSPSHPVSWVLIGTRDPRLVPELDAIAKRHEDDDAREMAADRVKELKKLAEPLAARLKTFKPRRRGIDMDLLLEIDPDRDRAALFEYALPRLASANEDERSTLAHALGFLAKVSLGEDASAWTAYWASHKTKTYDEWLIEALASDPAAHARSQAAAALGKRPPTEGNKKALRTALQDRDLDVRFEAAQALAALRDEAAILPLLRALPNESQRDEALGGLSHFSESNFGLEAYGRTKPDETLTALGRWVAWAKRRGIEPGFP